MVCFPKFDKSMSKFHYLCFISGRRNCADPIVKDNVDSTKSYSVIPLSQREGLIHN